jgi:hypothetical protein
VKVLVGNTAGGVIGSRGASGSAAAGGSSSSATPRECQPVEAEATPAISVTLALLPNVDIKTFHLTNDDVPEFDGGLTRGMSRGLWKQSVGLGGFGESDDEEDTTEGENEEDDPVFMVIPSPAFQVSLYE